MMTNEKKRKEKLMGQLSLSLSLSPIGQLSKLIRFRTMDRESAGGGAICLRNEANVQRVDLDCHLADGPRFEPPGNTAKDGRAGLKGHTPCVAVHFDSLGCIRKQALRIVRGKSDLHVDVRNSWERGGHVAQRVRHGKWEQDGTRRMRRSGEVRGGQGARTHKGHNFQRYRFEPLFRQIAILSLQYTRVVRLRTQPPANGA